MTLQLAYTPEAAEQYKVLEDNRALEKRYKAVKKSLRFLAENQRHPSLHTHKYDSLTGPGGAEVFEAHAENDTPGAYRIFWSYHPPKSNTITIIAITPHP